MNTKAMKGLDFNSHWACKLSASFFSYIQVEHCDQAFQALFFHPSSWTVWWGRPQRQRGIHPETGQCGHVNHDLLPSCFLLYCLLLAAKHSALSSPSTWNTTSSCAGSILTMRSDLVGLLPRIRTSTVFSATEILTVYSPPFNFLFLALVIGSEEAAPLSNRSKVSVSPSDSFLTAASFLSWTIFCSWELAVSDWFFSVLLVTNLQMVWQVGRILKKALPSKVSTISAGTLNHFSSWYFISQLCRSSTMAALWTGTVASALDSKGSRQWCLYYHKWYLKTAIQACRKQKKPLRLETWKKLATGACIKETKEKSHWGLQTEKKPFRLAEQNM